MFDGDGAIDLADVAPYLVRLASGSEAGRRLLAEIWGRSAGLLLVSEASIADLRAHFRRLLMVLGPTHDLLYFRFYDPRVLRTFLPTCDPNQLQTVFGPVGAFVVEGQDPGTALRFTLDGGSLVTETLELAPPPDGGRSSNGKGDHDKGAIDVPVASGGPMTGRSRDELLDLVRETAVGYDVFGELGRKGKNDAWFLGRKRGEDALVALRLWQQRVDDAGAPVYGLEVAKELGAEVSMEEGRCWSCQAPLRTFAAFCSQCGADQSGGGARQTPEERQALLAAVREAAAGHYEVLGEIPWSGAGSVYFALEKSSGLLVRLRLRDANDGFELKETQVGMTFAGALTATYTTPPVGRSSRPVVYRRPSRPEAEAAPPPPAQPAAASPGATPAPGPPDLTRYLVIAVAGLLVIVVVLSLLLLLR